MKDNWMTDSRMRKIKSDILPAHDITSVPRKQRRIAMSNVVRFRRQINGTDYKNDLAKNDPWAIALRDFMQGIDNLTDENEIARRFFAFQRQLVELRKGGDAG